jgi:NADPH:quinone reductase-like Zn-dependent oxidoreductase
LAPADMGKPGREEVLVRVHAIAINPIDWLRQDTGLFVQQWRTILGSDLAGEAVEVGEGATDISKGQRVLAHALGIRTGKPENSSFQKYAVVPATATSVVPDSITFEAASVILLALSTAVTGLYQTTYLALPFPSTSPKKIGKTILIWGGSSRVGSCAIQLAVASGLDVVTTASKRNFDYCKRLGAAEVFDYSSTRIVSDLTTALDKRDLAGAYDGRFYLPNYSSPPTDTFLAIGLRSSTMNIAQALSQLGGGFIASVQEPPEHIPATVSAKQGVVLV